MKDAKVSLTRDEAVQLAKLLQVTTDLCRRCGDEVNMGRSLATINLLTERLDEKPVDAVTGLTDRSGKPLNEAE